jgi:hypothetical protein
MIVMQIDCLMYLPSKKNMAGDDVGAAQDKGNCEF